MLFLVLVIAIDSSIKWFFYLREHGFVAKETDKEEVTKEKDPAMEIDI